MCGLELAASELLAASIFEIESRGVGLLLNLSRHLESLAGGGRQAAYSHSVPLTDTPCRDSVWYLSLLIVVRDAAGNQHTLNNVVVTRHCRFESNGTGNWTPSFTQHDITLSATAAYWVEPVDIDQDGDTGTSIAATAANATQSTCFTSADRQRYPCFRGRQISSLDTRTAPSCGSRTSGARRRRSCRVFLRRRCRTVSDNLASVI